MDRISQDFTGVLLCCAAMAGTVGCSSQQLYAGGQAWQRNECQRFQDAHERRRCTESAAISFEEYQKQAAASKGGTK